MIKEGKTMYGKERNARNNGGQRACQIRPTKQVGGCGGFSVCIHVLSNIM